MSHGRAFLGSVEERRLLTSSRLNNTEPPGYFQNYLNQASIQNALGVTLNYTTYSNNEIYYAFQQTGDFVYEDFKEDLEIILEQGVSVTLIYGDADYICNW